MGAECCSQHDCSGAINGVPDNVETAKPIEFPKRNTTKLGDVREHPNTKLVDGVYVMHQAFAIVRHADRLDHTPNWKRYPGRLRWPNDSPLTASGHKNASKAGKELAACGHTFDNIISSPYLRCAETASRIAAILKIPVHFDLDLGEVFDNISMRGVIAGKPQHRQPKDLEEKLNEEPEFRDVSYFRDSDGLFKIEGQLQSFPEDFHSARMRFCFKVQKLVQQAAARLKSIVIVTHGDAVCSVVGMLKSNLVAKSVPFTSYFVAARSIKGKDDIADQEQLCASGVFNAPDQWEVKLSKEFENAVFYEQETADTRRRQSMEVLEMEKKAGEIFTEYSFESTDSCDESDDLTKTSLSLAARTTDYNLGFNETKKLLSRSKTCKQFTKTDRMETHQDENNNSFDPSVPATPSSQMGTPSNKKPTMFSLFNTSKS